MLGLKLFVSASSTVDAVAEEGPIIEEVVDEVEEQAAAAGEDAQQALQEVVDEVAAPAAAAAGLAAAPAAPAALAANQAEVALQHVDMVASLHRETAEIVASSLGNRFEVNTQILLMSPESIQQGLLALNTAPAFMRQRVDTQKNFSWAFAGFYMMECSFFPGGDRSPENCIERCVGCLTSGVRISCPLRLEAE